jgi:hypothetical protein
MTRAATQARIFDFTGRELARDRGGLPSKPQPQQPQPEPRRAHNPNEFGMRTRHDPLHPEAARLLAEIEQAGRSGLFVGKRSGTIILALYDLHRSDRIEWTGAPWTYRTR